jgi:hypothetical protein
MIDKAGTWSLPRFFDDIRPDKYCLKQFVTEPAQTQSRPRTGMAGSWNVELLGGESKLRVFLGAKQPI